MEEKEQMMRRAALGVEPAELVLKGGKVLNVFSEQWIEADVAICADRIVGVGNYKGRQEIEVRGRYLVPGLMDAHMHLESSMVLPAELESVFIPSGTTAVILDPHEMVNVSGTDALDFLLEEAKRLVMTTYIMLPSSVPSTDFDTNGAGDFSAQDMRPYMNQDGVLGLGEVMRYVDVLEGRNEIMEKLELFSGRPIDGHAPNLHGAALQAYRLAGVDTDHECTTWPEAREKLAAGMAILIREGSAAKNLEAIVTGLLEEQWPVDRCAFCTDDKHLDDIEREGHISHCVRKAIALGMPASKAYKMASWNIARLYGIQNRGAIAAGYIADILVLSNMEDVLIEHVFVRGKEYKQVHRETIIPEKMLHTVKFEEVKKEQLAVYRHEKNHVIEIVKGQLITRHKIESIPGDGKFFVPNEQYSKLCVVERHGKNGLVGVAPLKGFGIRGGALATTVAHDAHNIIAVGDNDRDLLVAIHALRELGGGYVIAKGGKVKDALALPICGLMSDKSAAEVRKKTTDMLDRAEQMGTQPGIDPFITLSFLALPVIPEIRLTERGLFDAVQMRFIEEK